MTPDLTRELVMLVVLPIPIASIAWTVTHEEVFREPREWCRRIATSSPNPYARKFFYLFTCEYCFSHYVTAAVLLITRYTLFFDDWRGYIIGGFSLVFLANVYMTFFGRMRLEVKGERLEVAAAESKQRLPDARTRGDENGPVNPDGLV